jgi:hypothetical protein
MPRRRGADVAVAAGLVALAFALHHAALGFWWTHDDFFQVGLVAERAPSEYTLDPAVWRELPIRSLTPLLMASLDADLALFGPAPRLFYLHQLAALGLAAAALFALLRRGIGRGWAAAGGALFLLGPATAPLAAHLMVRHYVEGLLLALLAALAWTAAVRRGSGGWAAASAALAFAAMLAKEVFVPLVVLLPLVGEGPWRRRLRLWLPHGTALAVYLAYRGWMLGRLAGAMGIAVPGEDRARVLAALPLRLVEHLAGGSLAGWLAVALALAATVGLAARGRRAAALVVAAGALLVAPLLPVAAVFETRYAAVPWAALSLAAACAGARLAGRGPAARHAAVAAGAVLLAAAFAGHRAAWADTVGQMRRLAVENRAFVALGPRDLIAHPAERPAALDALPAFAARFHGRSAVAGRFADDLFLCLDGARDRRVWRWDERAAALREVTDELPAWRRAACGAVDPEAPLSVRLDPRPDAVWWHLGPHQQGDYRLLLADGVRALDVPRHGGYHLLARTPVTLRIAYRSPEGWTTYSPELTVEPGSGKVVVWRRGG